MKRLGITVLTCLLWFAASPLAAQTLEDFVAPYTGNNGEGFMQPLADAFGGCMNSGLYHGAKISKAGFHLYIGLETMTAIIGDKQKTFKASTEDFVPAQTVDASTIFGSRNPVVVNGQGGTQYAFPGGMNLKRLPLAMPQLTIGAVAGTEATLRWISTSVGEDIGKVEVFGWGLRHSLSQYLLAFPADLAAGFYMQTFKVGDIVDAQTSFFGVQASISQSLVTFYGGLGMESSKLNVSYTSSDETKKIEFDLKGKNGMRLTLGAALDLPGLKLHADYNIASQNILAIGLGVGF